MLSNDPELRKEIISQRQEERKIRRKEKDERERVKEIKSIKRSVFGKILQSLPGHNGRRELLSFTSKALDNPYPN